MSDSKEDWNKNDPNENKPLEETENMDINPDEYTITEVEEEPNQMPGCSNEATTNKPKEMDGQPSDSKMPPIKLEFGLPSFSRDKLNVHLTWDTEDSAERPEDEFLQNISMRAVVNVPYNEMIQGVNAVLKCTQEPGTKETKTTGTQTTSSLAASSSTTSSPEAPRVDMMTNYQYPDEYDDYDVD